MPGTPNFPATPKASKSKKDTMRYLEDLSASLSTLIQRRDLDDPLVSRHVSPHLRFRDDTDQRFTAISREEHWNLLRQQFKSAPVFNHTVLDITCSHVGVNAAEVWITYQVTGLFPADGDRVLRTWIKRLDWRKEMESDVDEPVWTIVSVTGMHGSAGYDSGI